MDAANSSTNKHNGIEQPYTATLPSWVNEPAEAIEPDQSHSKGHAAALLTVDDVAAYLRVSTKTVRRQIAAGHISAIRIGRSIRVSADELARLVSDKYSRVINRKEKCSE